MGTQKAGVPWLCEVCGIPTRQPRGQEQHLNSNKASPSGMRAYHLLFGRARLSFRSVKSTPCPPRLVKMLVLLAFIIIFHITSAALLFVATIDNAWWVGDQFYADVWRVCFNGSNCTEIHDGMHGYTTLQAVQATMILSTILCCIAFFIFVLQLFRLKQGERFVLTSIIQLMSCLSVMIAASIYTDQREDIHSHNPGLYYYTEGGSYGYSFILAWVAFAFTFISGLMYLILRKRK